MSKTAIAGNHGEDIRSDCLIELKLSSSGGIKIELDSKVNRLYGKHMHSLVGDIFSFFEIRHARISIYDSGSLDFVLAARTEAAIKQLIDTDKEYLMPVLPDNILTTYRDRFRFTRLYLPGNTPKLMLNAGIHNPDAIILDLEDSVAPSKKYESRFLVRNALRQVNFMKAERMVRINQMPSGLEDLDYIVLHHVHVILIPKTEDAEQVKQVESKISKLKETYSIDYQIFLMPIIESALGVEQAYEIATASPDNVAMAIGLEDYTADMGVKRTLEGQESLYGRMRIVNACKAAGIQPIDSVYSDVADLEGLRETVKHSKALGFEGMGCIHPRQISIIQECFRPDTRDIESAIKIVLAYEAAEANGLGVVALGSKMIDKPVVKRAMAIVSLAEKLNILGKDWRNEYGKK
jgi:citrate lyase subunit beta/citryl-CoA lyase